MVTLPLSGGTPLVSCQRMRQTDGQRLNVGPAPGVLVRKINVNVRPLTRASRAASASCGNLYQYRDTEPQPRDGAPRLDSGRGSALEVVASPTGTAGEWSHQVRTDTREAA